VPKHATSRAKGAPQAENEPTAPSVVHVTPLSVVVPPAVVFHDGSEPDPAAPAVVQMK
jgi:hypothetical protein